MIVYDFELVMMMFVFITSHRTLDCIVGINTDALAVEHEKNECCTMVYAMRKICIFNIKAFRRSIIVSFRR